MLAMHPKLGNIVTELHGERREKWMVVPEETTEKGIGKTAAQQKQQTGQQNGKMVKMTGKNNNRGREKISDVQ